MQDPMAMSDTAPGLVVAKPKTVRTRLIPEVVITTKPPHKAPGPSRPTTRGVLAQQREQGETSAANTGDKGSLTQQEKCE